MNRPTNHITTILLIAIAVLATWQVKGCLTKTPPNEELIRNEMKLKALEESRIRDSVYYAEKIALKDTQIVILKTAISNNKTFIVKSNERIQAIPDWVNSRPIIDLVQSAIDY